MSKILALTCLLLLAKGLKTLASLGLTLCFLALDKEGPLAFLLPYTEISMLLVWLGSYVLRIGHPSEFELAFRQELRQAAYPQPESTEQGAQAEEPSLRVSQDVELSGRLRQQVRSNRE